MLPWMTIERNIMLPLKIVEPFRSQFRKLRKTEFRDKANALLEQVGLKGFGSDIPGNSPAACFSAPILRALIHERACCCSTSPLARSISSRGRAVVDPSGLWIVTSRPVLLVTHALPRGRVLGSRICVMSALPGRIIDDSGSPRPPRTVAMTFEPDFVALNQKLRAFHRRCRPPPKERAATEGGLTCPISD